MNKLFAILILVLSHLSLKAQQDSSAHSVGSDTLHPTDSLRRVHSFKQNDSLSQKDAAPLTKDSTVVMDSLESDLVIGDFILKKSIKPVVGIASFYSKNLDGTKTATGEIYRNKKLTGASNHFKMHSWVRVTNLRNHRSVIIRINDRMHPRMAKRGRVVDLSRAAAQKLDFLKNGLAKVKIEMLERKIVD